MTRRHLIAGFWLTLLASNYGCQHEATGGSIHVDVLEERISALEAKLENLSQKTMQNKPNREPSQFVTLYKYSCTIQGCGEPSPLLAGLSSEKCKTIMDAEEKKSVMKLSKSLLARKISLSTQFICDY
ncbi:MAG: hypothetical protein NTX25_22405 [Proteobacteria bacterium]|nr:hypothetical protein [Pseudomonadota bacterium]